MSEIKDAYCTDCICNTDGTRHPTILVEGCANPTYKGDGFCDDEANNLDCDYDGGDCCLDEINDSYCTDCWCYATSSQHMSLLNSTSSSGCVLPDYKGDGYCDDDNNVEDCEYDGGDCCAGDLSLCTTCACLDTGYTGSTNSPSFTGSTLANAPATCLDSLKGDDYCDDANNIADCDYDYGDCCLTPVKTTYCDSCVCHTTGLVHTTTGAP